MGDRAAEGALRLGALGVDVDPLVVSGCVRELVHPFLGDLEVVRVAEMGADEFLQAGDSLDNGGHENSMPRIP